MNKILILLIGFAFTQSIQTKQVEVTITDLGDFNLYELIENPIGETYSVELSEAEYVGIIPDNYFYHSLELTNVASIGADNFTMLNIYFNSNNQDILILNDKPMIVNEANQLVMLTDLGYGDIFITNDEIILTFWVTGMFEDAGVGLQGDMNDDEIINVVDIVALVNIIIGEE